MTTQQTRNHFWTSGHVSNWFIIGTAPPVWVFMCIHVNTYVLPVVTSFEWLWHESYWVRTGMVSLVRIITWKTRDFTVNPCRHTKFVHRIRWIHIRKHVNWASWIHEFTYRTCEITGRCLLATEIHDCDFVEELFVSLFQISLCVNFYLYFFRYCFHHVFVLRHNLLIIVAELFCHGNEETLQVNDMTKVFSAHDYRDSWLWLCRGAGPYPVECSRLLLSVPSSRPAADL